ncbi:hypothetical protein [Streptomyces sp. NPDC051776]|uniref:hypothetical protein n=1 Tax=Streptomyces sp. NPDC051776 TaxID=3155414 RepID=UPI00342F4F04
MCERSKEAPAPPFRDRYRISGAVRRPFRPVSAITAAIALIALAGCDSSDALWAAPGTSGASPTASAPEKPAGKKKPAEKPKPKPCPRHPRSAEYIAVTGSGTNAGVLTLRTEEGYFVCFGTADRASFVLTGKRKTFNLERAADITVVAPMSEDSSATAVTVDEFLTAIDKKNADTLPFTYSVSTRGWIDRLDGVGTEIPPGPTPSRSDR